MYDLIILGAGPAGLAASVYASRYQIKHLVIGNAFGGSLFEAHRIENWIGEKSIKGTDLVTKFYEHAKELGAEILQEEAVEVKKEKNEFFVKTNLNKTYQAKIILIAIGTKHRKLNISGEDKFLGKGVSYCAVCDGVFFKDKIVAVVGGGNSAAMTAELLSEYAQKVYIIYRKKVMRCEPVVLKRLEKNSQIKIIPETNVIKVEGEQKVKSIEIDREYQGSKKIKIDGLFIEVGAIPAVGITKKLGVKTGKGDSIIIDQGGATNIKGIYAAGDITNGSDNLHQIVTAVSEGAIAATSIYGDLKKERKQD